MGLNNIKINNTTNVKTGVVYDISKATGQSYETLADALGTDGRNVPLEVREGGMSVRFVHTGDNKYVQYMLTSNTFTTTASEWQKFANQDEVNNLKMMVGESFSFDVSLQVDNVVNTSELYLQPNCDYYVIINKPVLSPQTPSFWINSLDAQGAATVLATSIGQTRRLKITVPQDSSNIHINMRSTAATVISVTIQRCNFAFFGSDAVKELYIDPEHALYSDFEYMILERGSKVFSDENKWYEGILYKVNGQSYNFVGNIYNNETDALNACEGIKIYSNSDKTIIAVVDWSKTSYYQNTRSAYIEPIADYNNLNDKPIINSTIIVERTDKLEVFSNNIKPIISGDCFNINLSLTSNVVNYIRCYLQKSQNYDIIVSKQLTGSLTPLFWVVSYDEQGNYTILTESYDAQRVANITVPSDSEYIVINCRSSQNDDIVVRVNKTDFVTNTTEAVKELYVAPDIALYSNISGLWIARGIKIYSDRDEWYEGLYMLSGGNLYFACNIYNSETEAKNACNGIKIYSNNDKTFVAVIDWSKVQLNPKNPPVIAPISDFNSLNNKPIISNYLAELSTGDDWINRYPSLLLQLPVFSSKIYQHEDVNIIMLGDSFFAAQASCRLNPNAANLPPQCARNHTQYQIWDKLCFNKPQYDRWDSQVNTFAEVGTFDESGATWPTIWDTAEMTNKMQAKNTRTALNRYSATNNASISFVWDMSEYEKLNFIYRKSDNINNDDTAIGTSIALVTVDSGNGKALVYNGIQWVEANGHTFSMRIANSGNGYAKTMPDIKLKFKKVTNDEITITISNNANDGLLYYWGTERWNGGSLFITNIARGGFRTDWLQQNIINDLGERDCDLLIYESPLTNDSYYGLSTVINWETSIIQGGNGDWRDNANFKALSNDFTKFDLLCIVPHIGTRYMFNNSNIFKPKSGEESITYKQYFDAIRGLMETLQVNYIPLYKDWIDTSRNEYDNYYNAGIARQSDDVHPNDEGCAVYAHIIEPAIEI